MRIPSDLPETDRQRCEVWTRVMGYHRPKDSFNIGKRQEFSDRKYYREDVAMKHVEKEEHGES